MTISMNDQQDQMPGEMGFPEAKLRALEEKISHSRWVVPVLPEQELEALLIAATELAAKGEDVNNPLCQRFYNDALTVSFTKILTDDAVSSWKSNIQQCVRSNCEKLVKLCALKLDDPRFLNLLCMAFTPSNKFHTFNASRTSEGLSVTTSSTSVGQGSTQEPEVFAKSHDHRTPRGWLVHLINVFGQAGGFVKIRERFEAIMGFQKPDLTSSVNSEEKVSMEITEKETEDSKTTKADDSESAPVISETNELPTPSRNEQPSSLEQSASGETRVAVVWQLLRPIGACHEHLTPHTVITYLLPVLECIPTLLDSLSDEELKREARGTENKTDTVSCLIRACKQVALKTPQHHSLVKSLEMFRLKMILRWLQMSSFNGKMTALNEINQLISSIAQQPKPEWLTAAVMTNWIRENKVVDIVLRDSLHQPQYVEKLEKMLRFMIKENSLTRDDLDAIWKAQHGKHEAIVKNLHDLLAKLAWDFTPDQLDHLFDCFKASWATSSKKQSDKLLEVIRRLAEDDKDGVMANKVLVLFWNLAHSDEVCTEIMDVALANLIKILDYSCSQDRDAQKTHWLDKCVEELKTNEKWVLPALKMMREICCLYEAGGGTGVRPHVTRQELIDRLQTQHSLVILVTDSLTHYMDGVRNKQTAEGDIDWENWMPDGRYPHAGQVHERLSFLRFLLKDGQLWLCAEQAKQIWVCLAERPAHLGDREACFRWFSKLMGEEPDLDPNINLHFFRRNIMTLPPNLLTHAGIKCFERFFKAVNSKEGKLKIKRRSFLLNDADLIGLDYLWRVITECSDEISARGIELLREVSTCVGPQFSAAQHHEAFLTQCCARTQRIQKDMDQQEDITESCTRMCRVIRAIQEYVNECDRRFSAERQILPIYRSGRGRQCTIVVRFNFQTGQRQIDDIELFSHSNETLHSLRAAIQRRLKCATDSNIKLELYVNKLELYVNGELLDSSHDRKILAQIPLRDKTVIVAKVYDGQVCGSGGCGSSNESSSDSSTSSPPLPPTPEHALPGVLFAQGSWYIPFILELEHIGITKGHAPLTEAAHLLTQISPAHKQTVEKLTDALLCREDTKLRDMLYGPAPPTVAYNIEVLYSMVMPSSDTRLERGRNFQLACVKKAPLLVQCLSDKEFLQGAAPHTRRVGYLALVRLAKLALYTLGHLFEILAPDGSDTNVDKDFRMDVTILREALQTVPNHSCELIVKAISEKLANALGEQVVTSSEESDSVSSLVWWRVPTTATVRALYALAFSVAQPVEMIGIVHPDDVTLVRECMEVVTICMALGGGHLDSLLHETWWQDTALYLMIDCPNPQVRVSSAEQLLAMCAWGGGGCARAALAALGGGAAGAGAAGPRLQRHATHAQQFLQLLCRLVALAGPTERTLDDLAYEVAWLRAIRANPEKLDDTLLEGHLNLTKELFTHVPAQVKFQYGAHPDHKDSGLIKEVTTEFLWPYSWAWCRMGASSSGGGEESSGEPAAPLCRTPGAAAAAADLLLALVYGCAHNMAALAQLLEQMFYSDKSMPLSEWDYMPCVGPRPPAGLVGLKNAGATCYMNSVLQQLYCVRAVRDALLAVQGAATDLTEDFSGESPHHTIVENNAEGNADYNITILKQVQAIFAHLHYSKLQYYVPRGLWAHFRLQGEPVNLREQQDAVEFFMSLVESLDEALKSLGQEQLMAKTMGGTYSDQKICKGCPHRYCKEEPFSVVSLDIRNMSRLQESLEAYVRGELLEGADAYHCDKCNKKVVTVKRLCLNKLPPVLVIQLKRFEYDFEKVCAIKFNDYFEFPRELDVEPYTAWGLARAEGDETLWEGGEEKTPETHYQLSGIVVHSGQASGGHYYSYVLLRDNGSETGRWVKLDDGDVSECVMHDDEEMKAQCFGGEYMGEVFDPMLKRVLYKRQKRWWNAYMLFYTRKDTIETSSLEQSMKNLTLKESAIPRPIWLSVRRGNIAFSHNQDQFSLEHFNFMKKLCCMRLQVLPGSQSAVWSKEHEEMSMLSVQLATKFLFQVGFHTKKTLRGPAADWHDILCQHLRCSQAVRAWFATDLFKHPHRLCDYLLSCPSAEVRLVFMKIIVFLAHFSVKDSPVASGYGSWCAREEASSLSDQLLCCARALADPPYADAHALRHLPLLFNLFHTYALLGLHERHQLLRVSDVTNLFHTYALLGLHERHQLLRVSDVTNLFHTYALLGLHERHQLLRVSDVTNLFHTYALLGLHERHQLLRVSDVSNLFHTYALLGLHQRHQLLRVSDVSNLFHTYALLGLHERHQLLRVSDVTNLFHTYALLGLHERHQLLRVSDVTNLFHTYALLGLHQRHQLLRVSDVSNLFHTYALLGLHERHQLLRVSDVTNLFHTYALLGLHERHQLLRVSDVTNLFHTYALLGLHERHQLLRVSDVSNLFHTYALLGLHERHQLLRVSDVSNLFHTYALLGLHERHQLLRLRILDVVLSVCMDDASLSLVKYQYPESAKIHQVVYVLARCCDVSGRCQSAGAAEGALPLPNPYADPPPSGSAVQRPPLSPVAADILYNRTGTYMKKLTEECCGCEEGIRLVQFLCWEHAEWSRVALAELLWQMAYAYCHELRRHADALSATLLMEDSWQHHRIHNVIKGVSDERPGLLETAARARGHYQKRAYACVKLLVGVMGRAPAAVRAVHAQPEARRRWRQLLAWLQDELDRYGPGGYGSYGTWSPPGTSNETSSGYFLERSNSARKTLEKAYQLCPEEEDEDEEPRDAPESSAADAAESGDADAGAEPASPDDADSADDDDAPSDEDAPRLRAREHRRTRRMRPTRRRAAPHSQH
ncbi:probable ubiquitin carboxyl-terminal hydrolase FAF-X [Ostrinia nubilalis]|uniref:probable ubiquitin carboxyl-terminal hydrolase FAF-X n=1 Tax=Ostrinia nubilalis TaxID=29057 RepID=UPI0030826668